MSASDEEEDDDDEERIGGFGGIRNQSVDDIIAKARFTESFLTASAGLTDNLDQLAKLGDLEENGMQQTCILQYTAVY